MLQKYKVMELIHIWLWTGFMVSYGERGNAYLQSHEGTTFLYQLCDYQLLCRERVP
jgi:hypothetical protein